MVCLVLLVSLCFNNCTLTLLYCCYQTFQLFLGVVAASDRGVPLWVSWGQVCGFVRHSAGGTQHCFGSLDVTWGPQVVSGINAE